MTLKTFFGHDLDYSKAATMFSIHHVILAFFAFVTIMLTLKYAAIIHELFDKQFRMIVLGLLIILEVSYHIHNWTYPRFSIPLHICSFAVFMNIALLITKKYKLFEYSFFFGTLGGLIALLLPLSLGYTYLNFRYYHFIILHCLIMVVPIYFYKAYGYRVDYSALIRVYKSVIFMAIIVYIINGLTNQNYWYISDIPDNVSAVFKNYYVYIATFFSAVFAVMNILYFVSHRNLVLQTKMTPKSN